MRLLGEHYLFPGLATSGALTGGLVMLVEGSIEEARSSDALGLYVTALVYNTINSDQFSMA
jgi:hypothetical protein